MCSVHYFPLKSPVPDCFTLPQSVKGTSSLCTYGSNTDSVQTSNVVVTAIPYASYLGYNSTPNTHVETFHNLPIEKTWLSDC